MTEGPCIKNGSYCSRYPDKCSLCINDSLFLETKTKKPNSMRKYKKSSRMGANFEEKVKETTNKKLYASSDLTPNSGAGDVKGDIAIYGCINMALELKTKVKPKITRGSLSFTIQKEWLEKLNKESKAANKEFWALIFSFLEDDKNIYSIVEYDQLMSMIATMAHDRINYNNVLTENKILKDKLSLLETKMVAKEKEMAILNERIKATNDKSRLEELALRLVDNKRKD